MKRIRFLVNHPGHAFDASQLADQPVGTLVFNAENPEHTVTNAVAEHLLTYPGESFVETQAPQPRESTGGDVADAAETADAAEKAEDTGAPSERTRRGGKS